MIVGIGIDMVEIERIAALLNRQPRALQRLFSEREQAHFPKASPSRFAEYAAGRFAAKEAAAKALGTGIGADAGFADIEVLPGERGKPRLVVSETVLAALFADWRRLCFHLSITHDKTYALAQVIIEQV
ncbi:MAG: holo-ACP synthase [Brevibacillus sp.]|nr:holo-ACP synthase [Brevibacillus sp.]